MGKGSRKNTNDTPSPLSGLGVTIILNWSLDFFLVYESPPPLFLVIGPILKNIFAASLIHAKRTLHTDNDQNKCFNSY